MEHSSNMKLIRDFIVNNFYITDGLRLADEASLLDEGVIDSTGVIEIISFLESTFEITVADREIIPDNLDSVARIAAYVARKQAANAGSTARNVDAA